MSRSGMTSAPCHMTYPACSSCWPHPLFYSFWLGTEEGACSVAQAGLEFLNSQTQVASPPSSISEAATTGGIYNHHTQLFLASSLWGLNKPRQGSL